jgi:hypothetical protein
MPEHYMSETGVWNSIHNLEYTQLQPEMWFNLALIRI